jgi:hypothetical protein
MSFPKVKERKRESKGIQGFFSPFERIKEFRLKEIYFPELSNKILLIYLSNRTSEETVVLENASFQIQGDKTFLVGRIAEGTTPNDWASGVNTAISWNSIEQYLVFDSLQDYMDRIARSYTEENFH